MWRLGAAILVFVFLSFIRAFSQNAVLRFAHLKPSDGLSQSSVTDIIQDKEGFMWFATRDGLNKYDGYKFTVYKTDPQNPNSISNNNIRNIVEDANGDFWVATWGGGVNFFDKEKEIFKHFKHSEGDTLSISNDFINYLFEDKKGNIWVATDAGGLDLYDRTSETFAHFRHSENDSNSLSDNEVKVVFEDSKNNLWVATKKGIDLFNRSENVFEKPRLRLPDMSLVGWSAARTIFEDSHNNIWVGTESHGLLKFDWEREEFIQLLERVGDNSGLNSSTVYAINEDSQGNLWVGAENGGLLVFNPVTGTKRHYEYEEIDPFSIANNSIYSIYRDATDNMWLGFFNDGISFYNSSILFNHFRTGSSPDALSNNKITSIYEDSQGYIWVCTDGGGLNRFDNKTGRFERFRHNPNDANSICGDFVLCVEEDSNGNIWIGTWGNGVSMFNPKTSIYKHYRSDPNDPHSLNSNNVFRIVRDQDDNLWFGTYGGGLDLFDRNRQRFTHFVHDPSDDSSLGYNNIHDVYEDRQGSLWVATDGGGLCLMDKTTGKFTTFKSGNTADDISHNGVNCMYEDSKGNLWVGTLEGLNRYDRREKTFTSYYLSDGLPNEVIWGILEDEKGFLWLSTNNGLAKFDPRKETFSYFTSSDGLQSNEFSRHAYLKSRSGLMYFGGKNGFNEFDPEKVEFEPYNPPLVLTDFLIFNKSVPIGLAGSGETILKQHISLTKHLELSYDQSVITFYYASLNFSSPDKRNYAYMLEGFDNQWNEVGPVNTATYTNLDPGKYVFRVKGMNSLGDWNKNEIALQITINPPYWLTWWFKSLILVVILSMFLSFYFVRINVIKAQKKKLERQVRQRTAEVVEQKEEIMSQREALEQVHSELLESIRAASEIQASIFPSNESLREHLPQSFILSKPKDVVSGDFFWMSAVENSLVLAVVDCTGHGISGAFMSILGHNLLNHCLHSQRELKASAILDQLNKEVLSELRHKGEDSKLKDGMDIALCIINPVSRTMQFSGAKNPLYLLRNKQIEVTLADKFSIGFSMNGESLSFTNHVLPYEEDDIFYIFSDGYADQIGGEKEMKFMYPRFRDMLAKIGNEPITGQAALLERQFEEWKGDREQLDDIMIVGFKPHFLTI